MTEMQKYAQGQFSWVDLLAKEPEEAKRFYGQLFGWEWIDNATDKEGSGVYTQFTLRDKKVAGMGAMSDQMKQSGMPPVWNRYVAVDDIDPISVRIAELGGGVTMPAMQIMTVGRMAIYTDPQGATFSGMGEGTRARPTFSQAARAG